MSVCMCVCVGGGAPLSLCLCLCKCLCLCVCVCVCAYVCIFLKLQRGIVMQTPSHCASYCVMLHTLNKHDVKRLLPVMAVYGAEQ